eukprot:CAMPEP_0116949536 /NCGR_PEP_ID=MMETSP0467-20121206/38947_1 /TAXON_ID=283647 /ORGANISM="Mesodinium pulex, Strain SPMC105" /LENGTH=52 /DNA_ID=CAMNT_0004634139 /DNA_START=629 /DNA_END=787 /DNA_ORIENTATION=+
MIKESDITVKTNVTNVKIYNNQICALSDGVPVCFSENYLDADVFLMGCNVSM